jgi:general nucleoside transport system permease protein
VTAGRSRSPSRRDRRSPSLRLEAWLAIGLSALAWYLTLPPLLVRTPVPSLLLAAVAAGLGWHARRRGERRAGTGALAAAVLGAGGAVATCAAGTAHLDAVVIWSALLVAALRYATPVLFAALGGIVSERSGVIALGLEGMILVGAYFGIFGTDLTGSWLIGLAFAAVAGILLALLHAFWSITLRCDQVVSGIAVNLLALGITGYLFTQRYGGQGTPPGLAQIPDVHLAFLEGIPFVGDSLGHSNVMTWGVAVLAVLVSVFLFRTPAGLRLRAVGEYPDAAASAGLKVRTTRYLAVLASGALAALGGAYLSIGFVHSFTPDMTAGRGYIALAAVIFGGWRCRGACVAVLLFGFGAALAQRLPVFSPTAAVLLQALPYLLTLIAVAGMVRGSRPPAAVGEPY